VQKKKLIVMCSLLVAIVLLGIGTIAYFRRTVNGNITGNTGNLVLIVNEADAVANESFEVILQRSEEENFIMPDDKGVFNLNIDSTGSSSDVAATITLSRINLPENLKFYLDSNYNEELTTKTYVIKKADTMTKTVPVYWFWDGSVSDEDDSEFINQTISANISVTATIAKTFYETLLAMEHTLDTNVDFGQGASETNGQGLMMLNTTQNDEYPVLYYRGDVNNNNVIYAGYCWLIVRTTETGGIKLIYNGEVNSDGSCTNYSNVTVEGVNSGIIPSSVEEPMPGKYNANYVNAYINQETYAFNTNYNSSPVYVGYMYNDDNLYYADGTLDVDGYKSHLADNTVYEGAVVGSNSANNSKTKIQLMEAIDQATGRHTQNKYDSNIKQVIDAWYFANIKGKPEESLLEDTVWCNDRSVISETYSIENYGTNSSFDFAAYTRLLEPQIDDDFNIITPTMPIEPSLACSRDMDKFTVDSANGNGDLTHPVGMLTADEILMAGNTLYQEKTEENPVITYLSIPTHYFWALSPYVFFDGIASAFVVNVGALSLDFVVNPGPGVRASVSLGFGAYVTSGNGTFENPYRIS